jgi:hypothetical protein
MDCKQHNLAHVLEQKKLEVPKHAQGQVWPAELLIVLHLAGPGQID